MLSSKHSTCISDKDTKGEKVSSCLELQILSFVLSFNIRQDLRPDFNRFQMFFVYASAETFNHYQALEILNNKYTRCVPFILFSDTFLSNAWHHTLIMVIYDKYLMTFKAPWVNCKCKWF